MDTVNQGSLVPVKTYNTQIMRESSASPFPQLYMEVFIVGDDDHEQRAFAEMFVRAECTLAESILKADLVVFTGGEDVNPALYGEEPHRKTFYNNERDAEEILAYETCLALGTPMFGVCRGAQFLHVMNGGQLYQDVDNHNGNHTMWDVRNKTLIEKVSSVHHQMCMPNTGGGMEVLAISAGTSNVRWFNDKEHSMGRTQDIEAYFYRDTCCFGVQGHPEYRGYSEYLLWTLKMMEDLIVCNPDLELKNNLRRMKPHLIAERTKRWEEAASEGPATDPEDNRDFEQLLEAIDEETK